MKVVLAYFVLFAIYLSAYLSLFLVPIWVWIYFWLFSFPGSCVLAATERFDTRRCLTLSSFFMATFNVIIALISIILAVIWASNSPLWLCFVASVSCLIATNAILSDTDFSRLTFGIPVLFTASGSLVFGTIAYSFLGNDLVAYWQAFVERPALYNPVETMRLWNQFVDQWIGI